MLPSYMVLTRKSANTIYEFHCETIALVRNKEKGKQIF